MSANNLQANGNAKPKEAATSPYASKDPNSNVNNFKIIESTLRGKVYRNILISSLKIKREREKRMYMNA
jgi:homocitrate synthase